MSSKGDRTVDGAIHRAAGRGLLEECMKLDGCEVGDAKITGGHKLPAKFVIHTVGPIGEKKHKLESCYRRVLEIVDQYQLRTVVTPPVPVTQKGPLWDINGNLRLSQSERSPRGHLFGEEVAGDGWESQESGQGHLLHVRARGRRDLPAAPPHLLPTRAVISKETSPRRLQHVYLVPVWAQLSSFLAVSSFLIMLLRTHSSKGL